MLIAFENERVGTSVSFDIYHKGNQTRTFGHDNSSLAMLDVELASNVESVCMGI